MPIHRSDDATLIQTAQPRVCVDLACHTGEGPLWHEGKAALYWVDIPPGRIYRYDPARDVNDLVYQHDAEIGGFTIQEDGSLLLFCSHGTILHLQNGKTTTLIGEIPAERENRFNDVIAAPSGQVFCGTLAYDDQPARLYRLDTDGSLALLYEDIGLSNGMGFTSDLTTMYHTDTNFRVIYQMEFDATTGTVTDRRTLVRTPQDNGAPDGMMVDTHGTIWSARYGGWGIYSYSADGATLGFIPIPAKNVTSVTLGGTDFRTAFITTATGGNEPGEEVGEMAGALFRIDDFPAVGKPPYRSRISVK